MSTSQQRVRRWCRENNWTKPRQISTGDWVACPPGSSISIPLPYNLEKTPTYGDRLVDLLSPLILILSGLAVGLISLAISPLFFRAVARRQRQGKK